MNTIYKYSIVLTVIILTTCAQTLFAQNLTAQMKDIFIDGEDKGQYAGGMKIIAGSIHVGEVIKVTDDGGNKSEMKVIEIKDYSTDQKVKSLSAGKEGFFLLETLNKKKLSNIIGGFYVGLPTPVTSQSSTSIDIATHCKIDGREWKGISYYKSSSYFPNGNSLVNTKNPYLIISFKSAQKPDDRQLTMIHKEAKVGVGILNIKDFEFVLSGSTDGIPENACMVSNWKNGAANTEKTEFYFEITKFEDKGDHIILSARYSGKIFGLNLFSTLIGAPCKDVVIKNGEIKDLKVGKY